MAVLKKQLKDLKPIKANQISDRSRNYIIFFEGDLFTEAKKLSLEELRLIISNRVSV